MVRYRPVLRDMTVEGMQTIVKQSGVGVQLTQAIRFLHHIPCLLMTLPSSSFAWFLSSIHHATRYLERDTLTPVTVLTNHHNLIVLCDRHQIDPIQAIDEDKAMLFFSIGRNISDFAKIEYSCLLQNLTFFTRPIFYLGHYSIRAPKCSSLQSVLLLDTLRR